MKIVCDRQELLEALSGVSRAVSSKSSIPAIEGILFKCTEDAVILTAYDLEIGIITAVNADIQSMGEIVLNARLLTDMVRKMDCDTVTIETNDNMKVSVRGGITKFNFIGIPSGDFPEMPAPDTDDALSIPSGELREMIGKTIYAVATDNQKPVHTGTKFIIENGELTMVSVDGYRLAVCTKKGLNDVSDRQFIVPGKTLSELSKLLSDSDDEVTIGTARRYAVFKLSSYTVVTRLLEGDFLDYKRAIPAGYKTRIKMDVRSLCDAVERASLIISDRFKSPVRLSFDGGVAVVTCTTTLGNSYDEIGCGMEGDPVEIGFNNRYILDAMRNSGCDEVYLEINGPTSPMKVLPTEGDRFLYLVLPVRIKNEL